MRVSFGGYYGSGALLFDGHAVLTAAHLFAARSGTASVGFDTGDGLLSLSSSRILTHPGYDARGNNDLAIVWLSSAAPTAANRYGIYRDSDEIGQSFTLVSYGQAGTGAFGAAGSASSASSASSVPARLKASNQFDIEGSVLKAYLGSGMAWTPLAGTQLVADFDDGTVAHDALGQLAHRTALGLGLDEGLISPGDSGGPAFIDGRIAGVASYVASLESGHIAPDVDKVTNSSFGEIAAWQRVSAYQQWIDQSLRANYPDAPTRPDEVRKEVAEGDEGTSYAYFLLQFTGVRSDPNQILSVDYATRNGTAAAGTDYIAASGTLNLYPGENQAVIPVEILGDAVAEPNESFYLDVFNPVGGSFGEGVVKLTAVRTIIDDDAWLG